MWSSSWQRSDFDGTRHPSLLTDARHRSFVPRIRRHLRLRDRRDEVPNVAEGIREPTKQESAQRDNKERNLSISS